jgi:plastocyanin
MRKYPWLALVLGSVLGAGCGSDDAEKKDASSAPSDASGSVADGAAVTPDVAAMDVAVQPDGSAPASDTSAADVAASVDGAADAAAVTDGPPGSMAIGPEGGTVMMSAGKLVIPAGALTQTAHILFRFVNTNFPNIPGNAAPLSSVISLEPHGQTFAKPVTLTLSHFGGAMPVTLYTAQPGGTFTAVPNAVFTTTSVEAALTHFSYFVVAPTVGGTDAGADTATATPDTGTGPTTFMVKVRGETMSFDPESLEVKVGDTVTWVWEANGHSVVSGGIGGLDPADCASDGKFSSGAKNTGETFSFTFTAAGSYGYHCAAHCAQYEGGRVVVK